MHRSIHELWGFGQLEEWDEKSGSSPFNNRNLVTELEIRPERRRDRRPGRRRPLVGADWRTTWRPSTSPTAPGRIPIRRARSARPTGRSTFTGTSTGTSASAPTSGADPYILENASAERRQGADDARRSAAGALRRAPAAGNHRPAGRAGCSGSTTAPPTAPSAPRSSGEVAAAEGSDGRRAGRARRSRATDRAGRGAAQRRRPGRAVGGAALVLGARRAATPRACWTWRRCPSRPTARTSPRRPISARCSPIWRARGFTARSRCSW